MHKTLIADIDAKLSFIEGKDPKLYRRLERDLFAYSEAVSKGYASLIKHLLSRATGK